MGMFRFNLSIGTKVIFLIGVFLFAVLQLTVSEIHGNTEIIIYGHNVRYAAMLLKRSHKELPWSDRKVGVINSIKSETRNVLSLVGLQETNLIQLQEIIKGLNEDELENQKWTYFGIGRDNGKEKGEFSPVLYKEADWKLLGGTTNWLSLTPEKPSRYPGADKNRIVTITTFMHITTGKGINFLNTHLDHKSKAAREYSAALILNLVKSLPNNYPIFLTGDFNSKESDEAYRIVSSEMSDSSKVAENSNGSELDTFSGFGDKKMYNIDFIWSFNSPSSYSTPIPVSHSVVDNYMDNGFRFSDHRPIVARYLI